MQTPTPSTCSVLGHQLDPVAEKNCAAPDLYNLMRRKLTQIESLPQIEGLKAENKILTPKTLPPSVPQSPSVSFERQAGAAKKWSLRRRLSTNNSFPTNNKQSNKGSCCQPDAETCSYIFLIVLSVQTHRDNNRQTWPTRNWNLWRIFLLNSIDSMQLISLRHDTAVKALVWNNGTLLCKIDFNRNISF